ncbi:MAG: 2-amino-4-hydroxy-6-hydroxymethyldihydropteridine diphosphokinase [Candidatus Eisenbacteria bacterium]|uniref:2-amino-4-hydroxy-6-hydroxymethyldihydropteridine diphosphokinase n=1 Tax=Eiseniibacteriota bacterium TaxID=2212470 RepID=A0A538TR66_UNCEI|nr:MAG: 2-amino-4-hydroxy-6-hydroxymethyldihydropteridine diphosphokinase [Candidatus Eisenbacteria bacterium]TMQ66114.1 MAG: 2-amino-4-hydroxy-6-hydroxymethyldihydropteridine diphosphokinase [Candidatus Eisenbacteria bacterium]
MSKVFVGVGSNLGDREFLIRKAVEAMRDLPRTLVVRVSSLYDTDPVGEVDQPAFLNAAVWLETTLEPRELLWQLLLIEKRMGRVRSQRWGPRPIDLDLLFYGEETVDEPDLKIPHPEAHRRAFVLLPLVELDPDFVHPTTGESIRKLIKKLPPNPPVRKGGRFWY